MAYALISAVLLATTGSTDSIHPMAAASLARGPAPVWVFLTDKGPDAEERLLALPETYGERATWRRAIRRTAPGLFDVRDLDVHAPYRRAILATGATERVASRWLNAISIEASLVQVEAIAALPFVDRIEPVGRGTPRVPTGLGHAMASPEGFYGFAEGQLMQIDLPALHSIGHTGSGVIVGILDTGFIRTHEAFHESGHELSVVAEHDFVMGDGNTAPEPGDPDGQANHGSLILGVLGAYKPNTLVGGAYDASFVLCKTEDIANEHPPEEDFYVAGLEFSEMHGADVCTASLIYIDWYTQASLNGLTAVCTVGVNVATENGVHCCNAAGNFGHDSNPATSALGAPADAFQVITCGAAHQDGSIAGFSSDGPTADGRTKPEVLAQGVDTWTISPGSASNYGTASGTSLSTPVVACAVACLAGAHPDWTPDQMRTYLFTSADYYLANGTFEPTFVRGFGVIDAYSANLEDCNANAIPDPVEIGIGAASDCNANGVIDSCDIAIATSADANHDGIPDECACKGDCEGDLDHDVFDFLCFQDKFASGDPYADFEGDGDLDIFDFLAFQNATAGPCP